MVMVVADAIFEARRRASGLNASDEPFVREQIERVVDRLQGDGADLRPHHLRDAAGCGVRLDSHGTENGQSLSRDLDAVLAQETGRV
jgi:hypothetical protein